MEEVPMAALPKLHEEERHERSRVLLTRKESRE